jgi:hypothetical protein
MNSTLINIKKMYRRATTHKIYYAHSKRIYGTSNESEELKYIKEKFSNASIICPHTTMGELADFNDYLHVVDCCDRIIASEVEGCIGKGVFCEIARGFGNSTPVYVLRKRDNKFYLEIVTGIEVINENDWKNRYAKLIIKQ